MSSSAAASDAGDGRVFVLVVKLQLRAGGVPLFTELWAPLAAHCRAHEPETLTYELSEGIDEPDMVIIYERYTSRAALETTHNSSAAFKAFGAALAAEPGLVLSRHKASYWESGVGFAGRA
jgi:quinol monooxygenase YgiN